MIIAATGHRPSKLGGYSYPAFDRLIAVAKDYLKAQPRPLELISGMALGWDQAAAIAAIQLGIPFTAAVPCDNQSLMWPADAKLRWDNIIVQAAKVVIVSPGFYAGWKMQVRNEWMVQRADRIMALWNGDESGGTFNCIRYARQMGRPIDNVWEDFSARWREKR